MNSRLHRLPPHPTLHLAERKAELRARGLRSFDFGAGDPPEPAPDFVREAMLAAVPTYAGYPPGAGTDELRQAAADYCRRRFGIELDPGREILSTCGSKEAIVHIPLVLADVDGGRNLIVYGEPGYAAFNAGTVFAGAEGRGIPLNAGNRYLLRPDDLSQDELARTAIVFVNYPHNPTGQDMPAELFRDWVQARDEHGFILVSDEVYCDLYYDEPPHSLLEFGKTGCIALYSLSKRSGMTGYLTGFMAGDPELLARLRRFRASLGMLSPVWIQAAATAAWSDDQHADERREAIAEKRRVMQGILDERGLKYYPGNLALFLWVEVPAGETDESYAARLFEAGILVAPGSFFGDGQGQFVRLAMVPSLDECRAVASIWPR